MGAVPFFKFFWATGWLGPERLPGVSGNSWDLGDLDSGLFRLGRSGYMGTAWPI